MVTLPSGGRMRGVSVDLLSMGNADVKVSFSEIVHQNSENVRYARGMSVTFSRSL